ncbi:MAG TPA: PLP-dependent aminotransferase family protein [Thermomicrobiales bacterium]|jgi:GntR family transcriptional regulator/MocR family aminotransferase|nr:PLP-dependent aminotransferase family protein [Thermomicrobiales bacterium]
MPKRALPTERPPIELDPHLPEPLYRQLYGRLRGAILAGRLPRGARLPSTRALAGELGISRTTAALAYEQLQMEGYLESRIGSGTVVSRHLPATPRVVQTAAAGDSPSARLAARVSPLRTIPNLSGVEGRAGGAFRAGEPALDLFPFGLWAQLIARRARRSLAQTSYYQEPAGYAPLRTAIAAHIAVSRGVRCAPEQIILTAGAQGALDLAGRALLDPGEAAWIEDPGYFGARGALVSAGARLVPVPVDEHGLDVADGRRRAPDARLAFCSPSHQYPTGTTMNLGRRLALLDWAEQAGAWILEDDYDSEFRFGGRPLEALQGLDRTGRVLYVGTFSKALFPALRLGFLVAPADLIEPLLTTRRFADVHLPLLEQLALADFMAEGHFVRHLQRMREHYRERRNLLRQELEARLGGLLDVRAPEAGMQMVGWLPPGIDDGRAAALAAEAGILVTPVSRFSLEPLPRGGLIFGYASTDEQGIRIGVEKLAAALDRL